MNFHSEYYVIYTTAVALIICLSSQKAKAQINECLGFLCNKLAYFIILLRIILLFCSHCYRLTSILIDWLTHVLEHVAYHL